MDKISSSLVGAAAPDSGQEGKNSSSRARGIQDNEAGIRVRLIFRQVKRRLGTIPISARLRAHDPKLLELGERMSVHTFRSGTVGPKLKELAQLKVAAMVGCPFWIDLHSAVGRKLGITENQLRNLAKFETSEHFSEDERLVLHMATALTRTPSDVSDDLFATLRGRFSERELVELSAAIAWENYRARFNRTFALGSDGFSKISVCPLPER